MNEKAMDSHENEIVEAGHNFTVITKQQIQSLYNIKSIENKTEFSKNNIYLDKEISASLLFTGVLFGEYILSLDRKTAAGILGMTIEESLADSDNFSDQLCELLNIIVGQSVEFLTSKYKKLTMTVPKIHFGKVRYPRIKFAKNKLSTEFGDIDCYLYIDHMKLDIATSYEQSLESLMSANRDLKLVLKKLEEQQAIIIQSEKFSALGMMAGGVAHEINNPLTIIQLRTSQLKKGLENDVIDKKLFSVALSGIESTILRISKITKGLRMFARDGSKDPLTTYRVKDLIEESLALCQEKFKNNGVDIIVKIPDDCEINCRPSEISQVLINLLNNAFDAIVKLNSRWVEITCRTDDNTTKIIVTDSGSGIPKTIQEKLMQPFFTTKEIGQGTGLGLSISKGIIDDHNGQFYYNSESAHTQFIISFPKTNKVASVS